MRPTKRFVDPYTSKQMSAILRMLPKAGFSSVTDAMTECFGRRKSKFGGEWRWGLSDLNKQNASSLIQWLGEKIDARKK